MGFYLPAYGSAPQANRSIRACQSLNRVLPSLLRTGARNLVSRFVKHSSFSKKTHTTYQKKSKRNSDISYILHACICWQNLPNRSYFLKYIKEYKHSHKKSNQNSTSNTKKSNQNMTIRKDLLYWHTDRKADMHIQWTLWFHIHAEYQRKVVLLKLYVNICYLICTL